MPSFSQFWLKNRSENGATLPRIAFSDSGDARILKAVHEIIQAKLAHPLVVGNTSKINHLCQTEKIPALESQYILDISQMASTESLAQILMENQSKQKISMEDAKNQLRDTLYQGIVFLLKGEVEGLISGASRPTSDVVRATLQCIGPGSGHKLISGHFLFESENHPAYDGTPFLFADCAVVPEPSSRALAAISISAAQSFEFFTGKKPKVALLSFSTRGSAEHPLVDRIQEAVKLIKKQSPQLLVDGEIQVDAALDTQVAKIKNAQDSKIAGQANVFIFPTLESGNVSYKLAQRFSRSRVAGPILWGLKKPVSDLSRGCNIQEIADTTRCVSMMIQGKN